MKLKKLTNGYIMGGTKILLASASPDEILFKGKMMDLRYCYRNEFEKLRNQEVIYLSDHWEDEDNYLVIQIEKPKNFKPIISDFDLENFAKEIDNFIEKELKNNE